MIGSFEWKNTETYEHLHQHHNFITFEISLKLGGSKNLGIQQWTCGWQSSAACAKASAESQNLWTWAWDDGRDDDDHGRKYCKWLSSDVTGVITSVRKETKQAHLPQLVRRPFPNPPPPKKKTECDNQSEGQFCICLLQRCTIFSCWEQAACSPLSFSCVILPMFCHSCRLCCVLETSLCETRKLTCSIFELNIPIQLKNSTNNKNNSTITKTDYVIPKRYIPSLRLTGSLPLKIDKAIPKRKHN